MSFLRRITDEEVERLLAETSENGTPELGELASFVRALSGAVPAQPPTGLEAWLVPNLAATARAASHATEATAALSGPARRARTRRPRLALAAKVAVAAALVPASMTGLAFAGVTLPEPARSAFERVGIDLPNQSAVDDSAAADENAGGDESAASHRDHGAGKGQSSGSAGKSKSRGKSAAAHRRGDHRAAHGGTKGRSDSAPGQQGTAPGQQGTTPGQGGTPPGQGGTPPGQTFDSASPQGGGSPSSPPGKSKP
jgi:hypothetical protein